jgi:transcriptional regulator with XRE-family HTH domain
MTRRLQPEAELFGARLRQLRQKRTMTQDSLASASGLTKAYISDMERGLTVPSMTTILRLALAIGCKPRQLMDVFDNTDLAALLDR